MRGLKQLLHYLAKLKRRYRPTLGDESPEYIIDCLSSVSSDTTDNPEIDPNSKCRFEWKLYSDSDD